MRVFDPETGGQNDLLKGDADTEVTYTLYGGQGAYWDGNLDNNKAFGNGTMLDSVIIGPQSESDNSFKTLFITDPRKGEYRTDFDAYIFRLECQGQAGDDGNVYKVFLSTDSHRNIPVEGAISFRYTNSLLLRDAPETGHLYPYMETSIQRIEGTIHGLEPDQDIIMFSRERRGQLIKTVSTREHTFSFEVLEEEKGLSLDFQFPARTGNSFQQRQSIFINATSQSDYYVPFYSSPIGVVPRFVPDVSVEPIQ